jgi:hypothetical protein
MAKPADVEQASEFCCVLLTGNKIVHAGAEVPGFSGGKPGHFVYPDRETASVPKSIVDALDNFRQHSNQVLLTSARSRRKS